MVAMVILCFWMKPGQVLNVTSRTWLLSWTSTRCRWNSIGRSSGFALQTWTRTSCWFSLISATSGRFLQNLGEAQVLEASETLLVGTCPGSRLCSVSCLLGISCGDAHRVITRKQSCVTNRKGDAFERWDESSPSRDADTLAQKPETRLCSDLQAVQF